LGAVALSILLLSLLGSLSPSLAAAPSDADSSPRESQPKEADKAREYQVKAAFLYNFFSYTTWPKEALPEKGKPFVVTVIGPNHFGKGLEALLKEKQAHGFKIETRHYRHAPEKIDSHAVFVSEDNPVLRAKVLKHLKGKPILLVGEVPGLAAAGAHVNFYIESGKIRFEVNLESLRSCKLNMSSQLLKLAKIVKR